MGTRVLVFTNSTEKKRFTVVRSRLQEALGVLGQLILSLEYVTNVCYG